MVNFQMRPALLALLVAAVHSGPAHAVVQVLVGPTPIPDGEAVAAGDITVMNQRLAFALAVESPVPYGVPRGAIIDVTPVVGGRPVRDRVVFADFIPDDWSAWPNTFQKVAIVERGPQQAVVRATRDWGKVTITTTYTLRADADRIEIQTVMTNGGDAPLADLLSGQTLWPSAGYFFGLPGLGDLPKGKSTAALADRAVAYDEDWSIALHAPYLDFVGSRSKDLFLQHALQPGESRTFDAWLQVGAPARRRARCAGRSRLATANRCASPSWSWPNRARPTPGASVTTVATSCRCRWATTRSTRPAKATRRASRCRSASPRGP
jgi:hypothetical protein